MNNFEMRMNPTSISTSEDGKMYCEGLVNGTETWSHEMGIHRKFVEKVKKGTFTRAIKNAPRIDFLAEHDSTKLLASTENGSLELFEDSEGLKMRAEICPTSYGKDMYELMKAGMVRHMSFGFKSLKDKWEKRANGLYERTIEDMKLVEVSVVRNPAYAMSGISARNIEVIEDVEIPAEVEEVKEEINLQEKEIAIEEVTKEEEQRALTVEQLQGAINVLTEYMDSLKETEAPKDEEVKEEVESERSEDSEEVAEVEVTEEKVEEESTEEVIEEVTEKVEEQPTTEEQPTEEVIEEIVEQVEEVQEEKTEDSVIEEVVEEKEATENKEETVEEVKEETQPSIDLTKYRQLIKEDIVL